MRIILLADDYIARNTSRNSALQLAGEMKILIFQQIRETATGESKLKQKQRKKGGKRETANKKREKIALFSVPFFLNFFGLN